MTCAVLAIWFATNGAVGAAWAGVEHQAGETRWARRIALASAGCLAASAAMFFGPRALS